MMLTNEDRANCGRSDAIVSYIYDELSAADRHVFESHLKDCSTCTDEFAAISDARFSVFEWRKEEFLHLATPAIEIPYETQKAAHASTIWSWLAPLFAGGGLPVAAAALLLVAVGVALFAFWGRDNGTNVAVNSAIKTSPPPGQPTAPAEPPTQLRASEEPVTAPVIKQTPRSTFKAVQAKEVRRPLLNINSGSFAAKRNFTEPAGRILTRRMRNSAEEAKKLPALSQYDEDDDTSLRLADLFDDIGG